LSPEEFQTQTGVSRETLQGFQDWNDLLVEWSEHTNLVGKSTLPEFWERHALDSYQLMEHLPKGGLKIADLGAGAGFPGIALALGAADKGLKYDVVLVDSVGKKLEFLKQVINKTGVKAEARAMRVESLDPAEGFNIVTARAFAPLNKLLEYAAPLLKTGAQGLFFKGRSYQEELTKARKHWTFELKVIPSRTSDAVILNFSEVKRVR
jgi:16S rRNA (guanine527-N7)-methyltransferase